jgi:hypothetical protein
LSRRSWRSRCGRSRRARSRLERSEKGESNRRDCRGRKRRRKGLKGSRSSKLNCLNLSCQRNQQKKIQKLAISSSAFLAVGSAFNVGFIKQKKLIHYTGSSIV